MNRLATLMLNAFLARFPGWLLPLALTLVFTSGCSAEARWFTRGPDPKVEAANRALERAAQIAAEAANVQARQHGQILEAVTALSSERTHMAEQLSVLGKLAAKDSMLAAALESLGPALVAMAALVLGSAAIWLVTRSASHDTELATMLVAEACCGTGLLADASPTRRRLGAGSALVGQGQSARELLPDLPERARSKDIYSNTSAADSGLAADDSHPHDPQEMPF
jgi:hypothetical protein